ncbi:hypothetical protein FRC06_006489 [Ceratobasidium sp. 370]|nr:hypothetical protein FRC06_006489 [Ceratobasidium sp. 370]
MDQPEQPFFHVGNALGAGTDRDLLAALPGLPPPRTSLYVVESVARRLLRSQSLEHRPTSQTFSRRSNVLNHLSSKSTTDPSSKPSSTNTPTTHKTPPVRQCWSSTVVKSTFVNIVDLVDIAATEEPVRHFKTEEKLREYTQLTGKYFPQDSAEAETIFAIVREKELE